jgi:molybdate transport system substrate-binding protein
VVFSCLLAVALFGCRGSSPSSQASAPAEARALRVAAAADVEPAFVELGNRFTAQSGTARKVVFSFASSSLLAQQVAQGAPFDLFAAANAEVIERLVKSGQIVSGSARPYARGRLVLWTTGQGAPAAISDLRDLRYRRIALANPEHAPYGQAAVSALRAAGLYEELGRRLIYGENIRQAHQYVATGNADVAIDAWSLAAAAGAGGSYTVVSEALYPPLLQVLGVVAGGDEAGAKRFAELVLDAQGQAILARHGFLLPR